jgi:aldose 1-epimerase
MPMPELVSISDGDSLCTLCPALGGSIASWSVGGQDMLRRADVDGMTSGDPLAMASFPLVPFSNRIGYGRFVWDGRKIELTPNFPSEPHAIHGTGWTGAWTIAEIDESHCLLTMRHDADARWPWSFEAAQRFTLTGGQLQISVRAANVSSEPAPLAFGHHRYFDSEGAHLTFKALRFFCRALTRYRPRASPQPGNMISAKTARLRGATSTIAMPDGMARRESNGQAVRSRSISMPI